MEKVSDFIHIAPVKLTKSIAKSFKNDCYDKLWKKGPYKTTKTSLATFANALINQQFVLNAFLMNMVLMC